MLRDDGRYMEELKIGKKWIMNHDVLSKSSNNMTVLIVRRTYHGNVRCWNHE